LTPVIFINVNKLLIVASEILGVRKRDIVIIDVFKIPVGYQHRNLKECPVPPLRHLRYRT
jgi:hypothetical protein